MDKTAGLAFWRLGRAARTIGWPAIVGAALALAAAGVFFSLVVPLQGDVAALRERLRQLETRAATTQGNIVSSQSPESQLVSFYEQLLSTQQAPEVVRRLHADAGAVGLVLESGEYLPLADPSGKLLRYQILLPVRGDYTQVRSFLARAMRDTPGLALEGIDFQCDKDDSKTLETQLRFIAYLRLAA